MGFLANLLSPRATAPNPIDDYWYGPITATSVAGVKVDADTALKLSTAWRCVTLIANAIGKLPLIMYQRQSGGGRARAYQHPLYDVLHDRPNAWQTAMDFRSLLTGHLLLRGNAYAHMVPGPRGFADQLVPLHPDRMRVVQNPDRSLVYLYRQQDGTQVAYNQDQIMHIRGFSADGITGLSVVQHAREALGTALATEEYAARWFAQNGKPPAVLQHPGKLSKDASKRLRTEWQALHGGLGNAHQVAVLEEGMTLKEIGFSPEDTQLILSREFNAEDVCRWFGVPPHLAGITSKSSSWGTGIEQLSILFVVYTLTDWTARWEQSIARDLILAPQSFFAEFLVDGLLRGDIKTRYEGYATAIGRPWMAANEARRRENMDPLPGLDEVALPLNTSTGGRPSPSQGAQLQAFVRDAAARVVRKEIAAMQKIAYRMAGDPAALEVAVREFYGYHLDFVVEVLRLPRAVAEQYAAEQAATVMQGGSAAMAAWDPERIDHLVALALALTPPEDRPA